VRGVHIHVGLILIHRSVIDVHVGGVANVAPSSCTGPPKRDRSNDRDSETRFPAFWNLRMALASSVFSNVSSAAVVVLPSRVAFVVLMQDPRSVLITNHSVSCRS
jgi:hypothetical protein